MPPARFEYLLKLEGLAPKGPEEAARQVPPALLEEVFALNEELDEIRDARERRAGRAVETAARACASANRDEARGARSADRGAVGQWDSRSIAVPRKLNAARVLEALRERFLERNYISNLLAGIERELSS